MTGFNMIKPRLPADYQEVEYIQSYTNEWIDTNITLQATYKWEIVFAINSYSSQFLGAVTRDGVVVACQFGFSSTSQKLSAFANSAVAEVTIDKDYNFHKYYTFKNGNNLKVGIDSNFSEVTFVNYPNINLYLFARNDSGVANSGCLIKLKSHKIWNGSSPIQNFIPCYHRSDGVIGLYDLCGSVCPLTGTPFYVNAGTGSFTKGPDVQPLIPFGIAGKIGIFNQLMPEIKANNGYRNYNITTTFTFDNGEVTLHASGVGDIYNLGQRHIVGHKYLIMFSFYPTSQYLYIADISNGLQLDYIQSGLTLNSWNFYSKIYTATVTGGMTVRLNNSSIIKKWMLLDLTDIFGSGNEPTTYAQARRLIKLKLGIDIAYYQPYGLNQAVPGLKRLIGA